MNVPIRQHAQNILFYLFIAGAAYALKAHYSRAGADDLAWILAPTAFLVETLSGIGFAAESGAGYFSPDRAFLIAPACAGVNFLIIAFCMAAVAGIHRFSSAGRKSGWILLSAVTALGTTLAVNTARIIISIGLYRADMYGGAVTPERIHRIGGVAVYFLFLYLLFAAISRILDRASGSPDGEGRRRFAVSLWPLFWYLAVSLGVPIANHAYRTAPDRFLEHALAVLGVSVGVFLAARGVQGACHAALKGLRSGFRPTA